MRHLPEEEESNGEHQQHEKPSATENDQRRPPNPQLPPSMRSATGIIQSPHIAIHNRESTCAVGHFAPEIGVVIGDLPAQTPRVTGPPARCVADRAPEGSSESRLAPALAIPVPPHPLSSPASWGSRKEEGWVWAGRRKPLG